MSKSPLSWQGFFTFAPMNIYCGYSLQKNDLIKIQIDSNMATPHLKSPKVLLLDKAPFTFSFKNCKKINIF